MRMRNSARLHGFWLTLVAAFVLPGEALAGWGDDSWGAMMWSEIASPPLLPTLGLVGLTLLAMGLAATAAWTLRKRRPALGVTLALVLLAIPFAVAAGTLAVPHTFVNGDNADADQVNANFDAVETEVNDNDSRITAAQGTANTALTNAASAQSTANTAGAFAAAAQATASTGVSNAASAQSTADTALANAATAQGTANTALTNAATAQSTADTAATNAATAVATANTAAADAAAVLGTANTAATDAAAALAAANATQVSLSTQGPHERPGVDNTAVGVDALLLNTSSGGFNTAFGTEALRNNNLGSNNIAVGRRSAYNTTGSDNIMIGNEGLGSDVGMIRIGTPGTHTDTILSGIVEVNDPASSGSGRIILDPTAVGSGYATTLSMDDTGMKLGVNSAIRDMQFQTNGTTRMTIESNGPVNLSSQLKLDYLHADYDVWIQGGSSTSSGNARNLAILGRENIDTLVLNYGSEYTNGTEVQSDLTITNGGQLKAGRTIVADTPTDVPGFYATTEGVAADSQYVSGINARGDWTRGAGFFEHAIVGGSWCEIALGSIGVLCTGQIVGKGGFTSSSDRRLKKNIVDIDNPLDTLLALRGVEFEWRNEALGGRRKFGFIAQEAEKVAPQVVIPPVESNDSRRPDGVIEFYGMEYGNLTALLTEAVKELKAEKDVEIAALEKAKAEKDVEIAALQRSNAEMKQRLALVEQLSARLATLEAQAGADTQVVQASATSAGG